MLKLHLDLMIVNDDQHLLKDFNTTDEAYEAERKLAYNRIMNFIKDVESFFELEQEKESSLGTTIKHQLKHI